MNLEAAQYPFKRSDRVGHLIQKEISAILLEVIKDPRVGFITLTEVKVSDDLKSARVYFSTIGSEEEKRETVKGLNSAKGCIQGELGRRLKLRYTPKITFFYDGSFERADRIDRLLKDII